MPGTETVNLWDSKLVRDALDGQLPTVNVSVSVPTKTLVEMAIAALVVGALLVWLQSRLT